jgi:hypothetical protein
MAGAHRRTRSRWPLNGRLVVRNACYYDAQQHHSWTAAVRHVVCLGSPHLGADLEKAVNVAAWALAWLPETRAIADLVASSTAGSPASATPGAVW